MDLKAWRQSCHLCPRECGVNRGEGKAGACKSDARIRIARASLHFWEEPCISGEQGSGTVFFSGCGLGCIYCQNQSIAKARHGRAVTTGQLSRLFLLLQKQGAENINLVTPSHYALAILEALQQAKEEGLSIPVVYNCSGYEKAEVLCLLEGYVDVYLTDFKYMDSSLAFRYSHAADYPERAKEALSEMVRQQGEAVFDERGMMRQGVILRHLLLPGCVKNGCQVIKYAFESYGNNIFYSLMNQYTPCIQADIYPELNRRVTDREYNSLVNYALDLGVENGFIQEGETAQESFIPDFEEPGFLSQILDGREE